MLIYTSASNFNGLFVPSSAKTQMPRVMPLQMPKYPAKNKESKSAHIPCKPNLKHMWMK